MVLGDQVEHVAAHLHLNLPFAFHDAAQESVDSLNGKFELLNVGELAFNALLRSRRQFAGDIGRTKDGRPRTVFQFVVTLARLGPDVSHGSARISLGRIAIPGCHRVAEQAGVILRARLGEHRLTHHPHGCFERCHGVLDK